MRAKEFVGEEYIHRVDFDLRIFSRNLAAANVSGKNDNFADAIVYLGAMGDPDTELKPVVIGNYDRDKEIDDGKAHQGPWSQSPDGRAHSRERNAGVRMGDHLQRQPKWNDNWRPSFVEPEFTYDILIRTESDVDPKNPRQISKRQLDTTAHELRHRGFAAIDRIPDLLNLMPDIYRRHVNPPRSVIDPKWGEMYVLKRNIESAQQGDPYGLYLTHAMMYSIERTDARYDTPSHREAYRRLYFQIESIARQWLSTRPVPRAGWEELRKEIDRLTPPDVKISIKTDSTGRPKVVGQQTKKTDIPQTQNPPIRQTPGIVPPESEWAKRNKNTTPNVPIVSPPSADSSINPISKIDTLARQR